MHQTITELLYVDDDDENNKSSGSNSNNKKSRHLLSAFHMPGTALSALQAHNNPEVSTIIIIPILQMRKQRLKGE